MDSFDGDAWDDSREVLQKGICKRTWQSVPASPCENVFTRITFISTTFYTKEPSARESPDGLQH